MEKELMLSGLRGKGEYEVKTNSSFKNKKIRFKIKLIYEHLN